MATSERISGVIRGGPARRASDAVHPDTLMSRKAAGHHYCPDCGALLWVDPTVGHVWACDGRRQWEYHP